MTTLSSARLPSLRDKQITKAEIIDLEPEVVKEVEPEIIDLEVETKIKVEPKLGTQKKKKK